MSNQPSEVDVFTCIRCGVEQPVDRFSKDRRLKSGHMAGCKSCVSRYQQGWYDRNKADKSKKNEAYRRKHWEEIREKAKARFDHTKQPARVAVREAVKAGELEKTDCQRCSATKTEFHHTNGYDKDNWLVGMWLCRQCHAKLHRELRWNKV